MSSLETFTDSKANEEKTKGKGKGKGKGGEDPVGNHPWKKEIKKEPPRKRGCDCACGYSKMITVVRDDDPAYAGMKWMPCSCRSCGPTDASGRQQCGVTVGGFCAEFFGALCDDCREH